MATWAMSVGFVASFMLTGWHAHFALHLGPGYTLAAMMFFVVAVLAGLLLNLYFMAGQRYVLEFLAFYEPTSGIAEWVHDTVFGISQDRIDAAYRAGSHRGRCETWHVACVLCLFAWRRCTREWLPACAGSVLCRPCHFGLVLPTRNCHGTNSLCQHCCGHSCKQAHKRRKVIRAAHHPAEKNAAPMLSGRPLARFFFLCRRSF